MFDKYSKQDLEILKRMYPNNYNEQLNRLNNGYPIQYLIGNVDFYGYKIMVNENVLIPRFETEYLVSDTIKLINNYIDNPKIIDICSGSGCIAIALSKELNINVSALDISNDAIELSKKSAIINNANIDFINEDIYKFNPKNKYNVLISNPPYIDKNEYVDISTKYEPQIALYAKDDGLEFYKIILEKSKSILTKKNIIAFEIGSNQEEKVVDLIKNYFPKSNIVTKKDLNNLDRYIFIINQ
ncbi:MAG: peptide chain release factor N(5)-glutamine methyltransferase [Bacilli bacterium]|nr:peptide chain release factor N(5)-glutamine methyltransferase [Bacilli bacterium]